MYLFRFFFLCACCITQSHISLFANTLTHASDSKDTTQSGSTDSQPNSSHTTQVKFMPILPCQIPQCHTMPQPQWLNQMPQITQKPSIAQRLKKHFFDTSTYKERVGHADMNLEDYMQVLEHEGTFFLYNYSLPPFGIYGNNIPSELKFQLSLKIPIWRGALWSKGTIFVGYTQTAWFQQFNYRYSNPVRDFNHKPSIFYAYPAKWRFLGGTIKELRIGYLHFSNGIGGVDCLRDGSSPNPACRSRSMGNRIMLEGIWERGGFGVHITAWPYIPKRRDNPDIALYMGYANARLYYKHKRHFAEIHIGPIISDYTRYHGSIQLGYAYKVSRFFAVYGQYFYGYGNSLYEYNIPTHRIGVGLRAVGF